MKAEISIQNAQNSYFWTEIRILKPSVGNIKKMAQNASLRKKKKKKIIIIIIILNVDNKT